MPAEHSFRDKITDVGAEGSIAVYAGPPSPSRLSDEAYKAECEKKIAAGSYPQNFDCSQRLHTDAGMADAILELSDATKVARDCKTAWLMVGRTVAPP